MANYIGRTNQSMEVQNFLGINSKSSVVSSKDGEAIDINNWDIDLSGAITRRLAHNVLNTQLSNIGLLDSFIGRDNSTYYVFQGGEYFGVDSNISTISPQALVMSGWAGKSCIGDSLNGYYYLTTSGQEPIVINNPTGDFYSKAQTLKNYSIVSVPTDLSAVVTGSDRSTSRAYAISATTVRGETTLTNPVTTIGPATLSATQYITLSFVPPPGAYSIHVWRVEADGYFRRIDDGTLSGTATQFIDNGATADPFSYAPTVNDAYNTPKDWEDNGYPEGFFAIAIGKENRLLAWRGNTVWASAAGNPGDWYSPSDAFSFSLAGAQDNRITGICTLMDYTIVFTRTNCFIYSGSNYTDWTLVKIQNTGCSSHRSIVNVGDEVYVWGQHGPTTIKRILSGADIESVGISIKVSDKVFGLTDLNYWNTIAAVHDIQRQRVIWSVMCNDGIKRNFIYNYQVSGWTIHRDMDFSAAFMDPYSQKVYCAIGEDIVQLYCQDQYQSVTPPNYYKSVYYDLRTWQNKRMLWVDVLMDPTLGSYECDVTVNWDYDNPNATETHTVSFNGTSASTDGAPLSQQGGSANIHRIYTTGTHRAAQFVFEDKGEKPAKVLGWRGEFRVKGVR